MPALLRRRWVAGVLRIWLDEEWTPLECHRQIGEEVSQPYVTVLTIWPLYLRTVHLPLPLCRPCPQLKGLRGDSPEAFMDTSQCTSAPHREPALALCGIHEALPLENLDNMYGVAPPPE